MATQPSPLYSFPSVIDSSMLATFKACETKFRNEYCENWRPKEHSVHLHAGASFAHGVEIARASYYVDGKDAETSVALGLGALLTSYGDFECPNYSAKSAERMAGALEFYFDNYPLNDDSPPITLPSGKRGIEFSFAHPLPLTHPDTGDPLIYSGRMDAILSYAGGAYLTDEKTTTSLGATWSRQWDLRSQFTGYAWGCRESGIHVDGAIIRGVSILKTKYETAQAISYRPSWQIDRWYDELVNDWVPAMISAYQRNRFRHNLDHTCAEFGGCTFRQACASSDPAPWLETYFERRRWDPLSRQETKL